MASNFSGEEAKGAFTLPLPPRCTFLVYRVSHKHWILNQLLLFPLTYDVALFIQKTNTSANYFFSMKQILFELSNEIFPFFLCDMMFFTLINDLFWNEIVSERKCERSL
jgi:hypothetical protein